jgi:hypothetical protein
VQPSIVTYLFHCITAEGSYLIGDEVQVSSKSNSGGVAGQGLQALMNSTNINIYYGTGTPIFNLITKGGGAEFNLTNANWKLILRAYVFN